jgi:uncharacterized protein
MLPNFPLIRLVSSLIVIIALSQCTKITEVQIDPPVIKQEQPQPKVATTPYYTMPATAYLALAKNQIDEEKQNLLVLAAGRFISDGQWREGVRTLAQTSNLTPRQTDIKNILLAKVDLIREQPRFAIAKLANVNKIIRLPPFYQIQFHEILAQAYEPVGNAAESVIERIKLEQLLPDEDSRNSNRRILWLTLSKLPIAELHTLAIEAADDAHLQGWMELALIQRQSNDNAQTIFAKVSQWQDQYFNHPANNLLPSPLSALRPYLHDSPRQMALLLPLSGPLAGPGLAIRDGVRDAAVDSATKIRLYDTASDKVTSLYKQAIEDGADFVIGPLTKAEVASVATMEHPIPTLLLNDTDVANAPNVYCFSLSPNNEAKQIAIKASKKGYKHALIIAPAGTWGDEIVKAFVTQWQANGGVVVDKLAYDSKKNLDRAVRNLLHISESYAREKQLKRLLGDRILSTPRRRQDFDMIFLLAYPSKGRQIMPLLKYYFAGNVPVYATSTVYGGSPNTLKDKDLDGIIFSDMPWVFTHQMGNRNWPEQLNSYSRLYALGLDSFALSRQLNQLLLFPAMGISDKSGILYLNQAQQIARIPAWGKFRGGKAVYFGGT